MILDTEKQRNLLLALISEHAFTVPGKALKAVAIEIDDLVNSITQASLVEDEDPA